MIQEVIYRNKKHRMLFIAKLLLLTISFLLCNISISVFSNTRAVNDKYSFNLEAQQEYKVIDTFDDTFVVNLMKNPDQLHKLKSYCYDIRQIDGFMCLETTTQSIAINVNKKVLDIPDYLHLDKNPNNTYELDGIVYTPVQGLHINTPLSYRGVTIIKGEDFPTNSFFLKSQDGIPTISGILGYEFSDVFSVGDVIEIESLMQKFNLHIVGIADKDSAILYNGKWCFIDTSIIIPSMFTDKVPTTKEEITSQVANTLFRANVSYVATGIDSDVTNLVASISKLNEMYGYHMVMLDFQLPSQAKLFQIASLRSTEIFNIISIVTLVFTQIMILMILWLEQKMFMKNNTILILSGASMFYVSTLSVISYAMLFFMSHAIALFITLVVYQSYISYSFTWVAISILLFIIVAIHLHFMIRKTNIENILRGGQS